MKHFSIALAAAALTGAVLTANPAAAQPYAKDRVETWGPRSALFQSGMWTLAGTYVPSLVVSFVSPHSFDRSLAIPLAGPWIDYSKRDCTGCNHETLNKVLLVGDGVLQAVGAVKVVSSLFFVEHKVTRAGEQPVITATSGIQTVSFGFGRVAGAYGATARGTF